MDLLFTGVLNLSWWGCVLAAVVMTQITIAAVTLFLHRSQTHHAVDFHPAVNHFFRLWLWLTTGMKTKEWVAVHRKHHAKCETPEDPHSPQVLGINRVLWGGVFLYVKTSNDAAMVQRYGTGTPDDWLERNLYSRYVLFGLTVMGMIDVILFGIVPGLLILAVQLAWIPFWAAGVINGAGHYWGYRSWSTVDASTNLSPWGVWIGGEELHNNHHAFSTSAKFSIKPFEFDLGWFYIRVLETLGLAKVKHMAPVRKEVAPRTTPDAPMLTAIIEHRYEVLARYDRVMKQIEAKDLAAHKTMIEMRRELMALWERSLATQEQLVAKLQNWCQRAEGAGIRPLVELSQSLRSYA
jgi:stearoyl-CoA desaturase (Delta-9 desaturase)